MNALSLNIPLPKELQREKTLRNIQKKTFGYAENLVHIDVQELLREIYTVLHYDGFASEDRKHVVFATHDEAVAYFDETIQKVQYGIEHHAMELQEIRDDLQEEYPEYTKDDLLKAKQDNYFHQEFLKDLRHDGVQYHHTTVPVYTISYPTWIDLIDTPEYTENIDAQDTMTTVEYIDFFAADRKIEFLFMVLSQYGIDAQNMFGYASCHEAMQKEQVLFELSNRYTLHQLFIVRREIFGYKAFRNVLKTARKSQRYTQEQINLMFYSYHKLQAFIARTIFEDLLADRHESLETFIDDYDTDRLRDAIDQYIDHILTAPLFED